MAFFLPAPPRRGSFSPVSTIEPPRRRPKSGPHVGEKFMFFLKRTFCGAPPPDTSRLCQMPLEIFLLIAKELPLESQFLLSRTCKGARSNLHRDWPAELKRLPDKVQLRCLLQIAHDMPSHLACAVCFGLHRVDRSYTPTNYENSGRRICKEPSGLRYTNTYGWRHKEYRLVHNHVQLALKYTRLGDTGTAYLNKLMRPWSYGRDRWSMAHFVDYKFQDPGRLAIKEYAVRNTEVPKIVDGRFLHESSSDTRHKFGGPIRWDDAPGPFPTGCMEHLFMLAFRELPGLAEYSRHSQRLIEDDPSLPPQPWAGSFSCSHCRIECHFDFGYSRWTLREWRDLGTEIEPLRMAQLNEDGERETISCATQFAPSHRPGPIEALYNGLATDEQVGGEKGRSIS